MSGGAITDHRYDTTRLIEWAREIKRHSDGDEWTEYSAAFVAECEWIANLMTDLSSVVYELDLVFSGDTGEDRGMPAIQSFKKKWCDVSGASNADIINMETYLLNCLTRIQTIKKQFPETGDRLGLFKKKD